MDEAVAAPVAVSLDPHRLLDELLAFVDGHINVQWTHDDEFYRGWNRACHNMRNKILELARLRGEATVRVHRCKECRGEVYAVKTASGLMFRCDPCHTDWFPATVRVEE